MTFIEAFASIFVNLWSFLTMPAMMAVYATLIMALGIVVFFGGLAVPHYGRSELWQRLSFAIGGPIIFCVGLAMIIWAVSSSPDGFTWA